MTRNEYIKIELKERGWKHRALAKLLGCTDATICRKLQGARQWKIKELDIMYDAGFTAIYNRGFDNE